MVSRRTTATVLGALSALVVVLGPTAAFADGPAAGTVPGGKVLGPVVTAPATAAAESASAEAASAGSAAAGPGARHSTPALDAPDALLVALFVAVILFLVAHRRPDGRDARLLAVCGAADVARFR